MAYSSRTSSTEVGQPRRGFRFSPETRGPFAIVAGGLLLGVLIAYLAYSSSGFGSVLVLLALPIAGVVLVIALPYTKVKLVALAKKLTWWHLLWLLIYVSGMVFRFARDVQAARAEAIDSMAMLRIGPEVIVLAVLLVRLALRRPNWLGSLFRGVVGALAFYALACLTTASWSVYPEWTLLKSGEYLIYVMFMATVLATVQSTEEYSSLFNLTWTFLCLDLLWTWTQTFIFAEAWDQWGRLTGVFPIEAANVVGEVGAFVSIVALCRLLPLDKERRPDRTWYLLVLILGMSALLASQTRNDLAAFLFGFGLIILTSKRLRLGAALAAATIPVFALAGVNSKIYDYLLRGQSENEIASLTGRMGWWSFAWDQFQRHPFTGLGAYAAGRFAILGKLGLDMGSLHSDYIETMVGTGLFGLIPLLAALIGTWWLLVRFVRDRSLTSLDRQLAYESIGVLGVITLHSFFNVEIVWQAPLAFLAVLGYAEFLRRKQKAARAIEPVEADFGVLATAHR
ncbi:MAG TPA: O-antigen ligase family protein [Candidatus Eremiobacteraceae bacterium]|nr:O-antigen ligase family protein [Candidatus Eremiobacteraceae bacterium]